VSYPCINLASVSPLIRRFRLVSGRCVLSYSYFYHTRNKPVRSNLSPNLHHLRRISLTLQTRKASNCQMLPDQNTSVLSRTASIKHNLLRLPVSSRPYSRMNVIVLEAYLRSYLNKPSNVGRTSELSLYQFGHSPRIRRLRLIRLAEQLASGRCVPLSCCASIILITWQSAAISAARPATSGDLIYGKFALTVPICSANDAPIYQRVDNFAYHCVRY
jgi:hypothetical protein